MVKIVRYFACMLLLAWCIQSCTDSNSVKEEVIDNPPGDSTAINPHESYMTGKYVMLSFEEQSYTIPYSRLDVDSAYSDGEWLTISLESSYFTVSLEKNHTVEYRNCHAYYRLAGSQGFDTVVVSQGPKDTFFITGNTNGHVMDYKKHDIYFDVFSNVEYTIQIPDSAKGWIQQITPKQTRSMFTDSRFGITVQANDGDFREAYISIQSNKSDESQSVRIAQDGKYFTIDGAISADPEISIFYQALVATGLADTLQKYLDYTYPGVSYDWTLMAAMEDNPIHHWHATSYERHEREVMPEIRAFKYTVFCVRDAVLNAYNDDYCQMAGLTNGIRNLDDLVEYAEAVYPEGKGLPYDNRESSINKLISYHILPYCLTYDQFNTAQTAIIKKYNPVYTKVGQSYPTLPIDVEDFYATLLPHSIMRISTPWQNMDGNPTRRGGIFINRKGVEGVRETTLEFPGTRIAEESEYDFTGTDNYHMTNNGIYHYVDGLLLYDYITRERALSCRMRVMASTLSPDFVNSGGRGRMRDSYDINYCYYPDYCENFNWVDLQTRLFVRYRDSNFGLFNGDEITVMGTYDFSFKLPPVPNDGNYEIRIWNNAIGGMGLYGPDRGIAQFYIHEESSDDNSKDWRNWDWAPTGLPVDLRIPADDSRIGMITDNSYVITELPEDMQQAAIDANDHVMRTHGYMKAPDSYAYLRMDVNCYRVILSRRYMKANSDYYLRMRNVFNSSYCSWPFNFVEIVPKEVYDGYEDRH